MNPFAPDEAWWDAARDPAEMLRHLAPAGGSPRKWRLFLCACARRCWPFLTDPQARDAVDVAERYADGAEPHAELVRAAGRVAAAYGRGAVGRFRSALVAVAGAAQPDDGRLGPGAADTVRMAAAGFSPGEPVAQAGLLRDVFGYPFRRVTLPAAWRTSTAVGLARSMYEARDFAAMPVLADALEEAGCDRPDVLAHCRGDGPHVRGCWVVDLVLGQS